MFSKALCKRKTFLIPGDCGAKYRPNNVPNILRNRIRNKAGNALTKLRGTGSFHLSADWLYCLLPAGISHQGVNLRFSDCLHSRLPPTHSESQKVHVLLRAGDANVQVSRFRLSCRFLLELSKWKAQPLTATQASRPNLDLVLDPLVLQVQGPVPMEQTIGNNCLGPLPEGLQNE